VLAKLWAFWNEGRHYYLSAGSDTHDVWNEESGRVRVFVRARGALTPASFVSALKEGHAYVSYGPLIFPQYAPGTISVAPGAPLRLSLVAAAVAGLKKVQLVGDGRIVEERSFPGAPLQARVEFTRQVPGARWYALVIEDGQGHKAYTDPYWVSPEKK